MGIASVLAAPATNERRESGLIAIVSGIFMPGVPRFLMCRAERRCEKDLNGVWSNSPFHEAYRRKFRRDTPEQKWYISMVIWRAAEA
jgi:hypothetical protein